METEYDRIIIGIDPGTNVMGYGVLRIVKNKPEVLALGVIQLNKFESHYLRLRRIFERVTALIEQYLPDELKNATIWKPQANAAEERHKERLRALWGDKYK